MHAANDPLLCSDLTTCRNKGVRRRGWFGSKRGAAVRLVPVHVENPSSRYDDVRRRGGINGDGSDDDESDDAILVPSGLSRHDSHSSRRYEDGGFGYGEPTFQTTSKSSHA